MLNLILILSYMRKQRTWILNSVNQCNPYHLKSSAGGLQNSRGSSLWDSMILNRIGKEWCSSLRKVQHLCGFYKEVKNEE